MSNALTPVFASNLQSNCNQNTLLFAFLRFVLRSMEPKSTREISNLYWRIIAKKNPEKTLNQSFPVLVGEGGFEPPKA